MSTDPRAEAVPVAEALSVAEAGPVAEALEARRPRPGAVGTPPLHYGNPLGEQKALAAGNAIVELSDRAVVTVTGPDRLTWLDSLTSQALTGLQPGESAETLLLDPTGRLEHAMRVIDDGVTTWLLVDGAEGEPLRAWLDRMRFMLRVEIGVADVHTFGVFAPAASSASATATAASSASATGTGTLAEALEATPYAAFENLRQRETAFENLRQHAAAPNGVPLVWVDPWSGVAAGGHQYAASGDHDYSEWTYREILVAPATDLDDLPVAGTLALEALRIAAWRPRLSTEADEKTIPHELDWLRSAVHLNKGCYRGQETVAKVHNLGHPPRRLVMLHLDGSEGVLPTAGDEVTLDGGVVGKVTSAALHYDLGPIALAVIKRNVDPAAELVVAAEVPMAAAQETIVPTDAGAEANVPRLPRLGAVTRPPRGE